MDEATNQTQAYHTISKAAEMLGISVPTIRLYEREGLIISHRNESGHRMFLDSDIERIRCLRSAINEKKISIKGIRHIFALIPCWRIKNCPEEARKSCAAFFEHDTPCWMVTKKSLECRTTDCRSCQVYTDYSNCQAVKGLVAQFTVPPVHAAD